MTAEQRQARARKGGQAAQRPEVLAAKIVRDWPTYTPEQRDTVLTLLRPFLRNAR